MESHVLPGFCGCPTITVSTYYFQIHTGCIHNPNYDDVSPEDLNSHPHSHPHYPHHHHHHTIHIGTGHNHHHHHHNHHYHHLGGKCSSGDCESSNQNGSPNLHQQQQQHLQNSLGISGCDPKDKDSSNKHHHSSMGFFSLNNSTLHCDKVRGESYWVSFHEKSFHRGKHFKVYKGIINGNGRLVGERCVVKIFANTIGTKELCSIEACKSEKFRELVAAFNKRVGGDNSHHLRATRSYYAQIDELSKLKQLFFSRDKKLQFGEAVLFEQDVRVSDLSRKKCKMNTFVDQFGRTRRDNGATYSSVVNAFVHFTHHHSNGELVVCGLNGVKDECGYFLSTPVIHSTKSAFGHTDRGRRGVEEVLRNHKCGQLCQELFGDTNFNIPTSAVSSNIDIVDAGQGDRRRNDNQDEMDGSPSYSCPKNSNDIMATSPCSENGNNSWQDDSPEKALLDNVFVQPSAPTMEGEEDLEQNGNQPLPLPPPYTPAQEARVALWIIGEESQNAFLNLAPGALMPCGPATIGTSMECQSTHTAQTWTHTNTGSVDLESAAASTTTGPHSIGANVHGVSRAMSDLNANFNCHTSRINDDINCNPCTNKNAMHVNNNGDVIVSPAIRDNNSISISNNNNTGMGGENQSDANVPGNANRATSKQVRFAEQPSYRQRPSSSAPTTTPSMRDDVTMESCTNPTASVSSSPSLPVRFRSHHPPLNSQDSVNNNSSPQYDYNTNNNNVTNNNNSCIDDINQHAANDSNDLPPPYDEHDVATANWLLSGRGGLDMYSYRPPVIIQAGQILRQTSHASINYNNNDNARNSAGSVFFALSPTDVNACNGRFF